MDFCHRGDVQGLSLLQVPHQGHLTSPTTLVLDLPPSAMVCPHHTSQYHSQWMVFFVYYFALLVEVCRKVSPATGPLSVYTSQCLSSIRGWCFGVLCSPVGGGLYEGIHSHWAIIGMYQYQSVSVVNQGTVFWCIMSTFWWGSE